jgi:hypothetical protein
MMFCESHVLYRSLKRSNVRREFSKVSQEDFGLLILVLT